MISQAMLLISMTVIAPAPCRGAGWSRLAMQYLDAHNQTQEDEQKSEREDPEQLNKTPPPPVSERRRRPSRRDRPKERSDTIPARFELHQQVWFIHEDELIEGIIREYRGHDSFVVFTHKGNIHGVLGKNIKEAGRVLVTTRHQVTVCDREDCRNKQEVKRRIDLQIQQVNDPENSESSRLCAAYELSTCARTVKETLKKNVKVFKQSKWRFKWACFAMSCLGCFGINVLCCPTYCFEGGDGMADTLCKMFCCCAATSDTVDAGEAATCGFCDYICCSDGGAAEVGSGTTGGDIDCTGCDCNCDINCVLS